MNHPFHHPEHSGMYQRSNIFHYWRLIHQIYPLEPHDRVVKCLEARTRKDQTFPQLNFNLQHLAGDGKRWGSLQPRVAGGCTTRALPSPWNVADNTERSKIIPNLLSTSYMRCYNTLMCWVGFTPPPLSRLSEDTHPTLPAMLSVAPRYLCKFPGTHHPVPAWNSQTARMTQQIVVGSAYESVRIPRHRAIQIMEDRHFVTVVIIVSKPLAWSSKKHFQSNLAGENKRKNYWLALSKDLGLQWFNSQNGDTARTRKVYCLTTEFWFVSFIEKNFSLYCFFLLIS